MKTKLFTCFILCTFYSFGQYQSTTVGYRDSAIAITDLFSQKFMPSSFIDVKGIITTQVKATNGLYVKVNNSSNKADVGVAVALGNTSDVDKYGFLGNEKKHKQRLQQRFTAFLTNKEVIILDIQNDYQFMDNELVESQKNSVSHYLLNLYIQS